jgi:hypothetical protein
MVHQSLVIGGAGILAVLIIAGFFFNIEQAAKPLAIAIWAGILIGMALGIRGIAGLLKLQ